MEIKRHVGLFQEHLNYDSYVNSEDYLAPNVSFCKVEDELHFDGNDYLTIINCGNNNVTVTLNMQGVVNYKTSKSLNLWQEYTDTIILQPQDEIFFKAELVPIPNNGIGTISINGTCSICGNIMSLVYGDDYLKQTKLEYSYIFANLFQHYNGTLDAYNLILPTMELTPYCYCGMFYACQKLIKGPELPATTLAEGCYKNMFYDCENLLIAPNLPATILAKKCYNLMFYGCKKITKPPKIYAQTLADYCCENMFEKCISLTESPELLATTLVEGCYFGMFIGCTNLEKAPDLIAQQLVDKCYKMMFNGCSKLNYIRMIAKDMLSITSLEKWVENVAFEGTFVKDVSLKTIERGINGIPFGWIVIEEGEEIDYSIEYFTIQNIGLDNLSISIESDGLYYRNPNITTYWEALTNTVSLKPQESIQIKGEKQTIESSFEINGNSLCYVKGNIMSLLFGDDFIGKTDLSGRDYAFNYLFYDCDTLIYASNLVLPATTLSEYCYADMFSDCNFLTNAPELPATTLVHGCYYNMFSGCESLIKTPDLKANNLASGCYDSMFVGCTSLTTAPELSALELIDGCYAYMFEGCTNLTEAPKLPATTLASNCYEFMFKDCTSLTSAPELLATTLVDNCYSNMFYGCSNLNYIKMLATDISANECLDNWVYGVADEGIFEKHRDMDDLKRGVNGIPENWIVIDDGTYEYFTIQNGSEPLTVQLMKNTTAVTLNYKFKNDLWDYSSEPIRLDPNDEIYIKGSLKSSTNYGIGTFKVSGDGTFSVRGNIMSLLYNDDFKDQTDISNYSSTFYALFSGCTQLIDASNLVLPATTLSQKCYKDMFAKCTKLVTHPKLIATTLSKYCYQEMFSGCTSLQNAPKLISETLSDSCYYDMFEGCTSLVTAPELPATTLANSCYYGMFRNCTSLVTAPELLATTLANYCYQNMFNGCTSLVTAPELKTEILTSRCYNSMFTNCTSLTETPILSSTTLASSCYSSMFKGCTNLTNAPELPATTLANSCYYGMFDGCTSLTETPILSSTTLASSCYRAMFKGCTNLTEAPQLSATTLADYCYQEMFSGCTSLTYCQETLLATELKNACYRDMFNGCINLTTQIELPAKTLQNYCYQRIFKGCNKLNYIKFLATDINAVNCLNNWVDGVADEGTFIKYKTMRSIPKDSVNGIPSGWTISNIDVDYSLEYFTIENTSSNSLNISIPSNEEKMFYYKKYNETEWSEFLDSITLESEECVFIKANIINYGESVGTFTIDGDGTCSVYGNVMSLLYGDDFIGQTDLNGVYYTFSNLFYGCTQLIDAKNLILPATILTEYCYELMFYGCTNLTSAPQLPATTLAEGCYYYMFSYCTSLTTAPKLSATTLADYCYDSMFDGCTSLTTAPQLPATTLANYCYMYMFNGCSSLTEAPQLPATTLADECYYYMFGGCTSLTTSPELPAKTLAYSCYEHMFDGCTHLTNINYMLADELKPYCYAHMFANCISLVDAPSLTSSLAEHCYSSMFRGCTSLTSAPELPATTLATYCYRDMFKGCTSLNYIKMLATNISANGCLYNWVDGVADEGTFVKHLSTEIPIGVNGIPKGWVVKYEEYYQPLTIENISDNNLTISFNKTNQSTTIYCKKNTEASWITLTNSITLSPNEEVSFRALLNKNTNSSIGRFSINGNGTCKVKNNIMSLIYGEYFIDEISLSGYENVFGFLFSECKQIVNANDLILPATTLVSSCYQYIFYGCTNLTEAPQLLATTLADSCYSNMFNGCTSLTTAPQLPATTLMTRCYSYMFGGCTSLTTAPELPATELANYCYEGMFYGCTSLTTTPKLQATILADYCYSCMFQNCTNLITIIELPATTLADNCYEFMFNYCTNLKIVPSILPATTLTNYCYNNMFGYCESLINAPKLPAIELSEGCYSWMFDGCISLIKAPILKSNVLVESCYSGMFYACENLNYIKMLATDISADYCLDEWVDGVAEKGTFVKNKEMTIETIGYGPHGIPNGWTVIDAGVDECLTIKNIGANNITVQLIKNTTAQILDYCSALSDEYECNEWPNSSDLIEIIPNGEIRFKATIIPNSDYGIGTFNIIGDSEISLYGNAMSLIKNCDFVTTDTISTNAFIKLFNGCTQLVDASDLSLHAIKLTGKCYQGMFSNCTNLKYVPELPATTLANYCYQDMFSGCTSLTIAPELPASALTTYCYDNMFGGCISLTSAPQLPATTLANYCYRDMFGGCTSLTIAPELPASALTTNCYYGMFEGCTSLTSAPNILLATTLANNCYYGMFEGCTSLTIAPELPASTLTTSCYRDMFKGCTSLTTAPVLSATTLANNCYYGMFGGCTSLTIAPELPASALTTYCYHSMFKDCTSLTTAPQLSATVLANYCYQNMFNGCTSLTTAPELPATTLENFCYNGMFSGCTSLTEVHKLSATTLTSNCYGNMFRGCSKLSKITMLATDISASSCLTNWVNGVANEGLFEKNRKLPIQSDEYINGIPKDSVNGIPIGWEVATDASDEYFGITNNSENTLSISLVRENDNMIFSAKTESSEWFEVNGNTTLQPNSELFLKAELSDNIIDNYGIGTFKINGGNFSIFGNILSLLYGDKFKNNEKSFRTYAFSNLFKGCTQLIYSSDLYLPKNMISNHCYYGMFQGCTNLRNAPRLQATTLKGSCYREMFRGCTSLTSAPNILPATELKNYCYEGMFGSCTSLTTAPQLPATTLMSRCYYGMFSGCTNLTEAPQLLATTLANNCYQYMFKGCTSLTTAPQLPATTLANNCYALMFTDCTKLVNVQSKLPATTLSDNCYYTMFSGCTSLTSAPELPATELKNACYSDMFYGCTSLTNAPQLSATTLANNCYYNMFGGCKSLTSAPNILPATTLANNCYRNMFNGCTSLTEAPIISATTLANNCCLNMFSNCVKLTTCQDILPAKTMSVSGYCSMFSNCVKLETLPKLPATTLAEGCYRGMFYSGTSLTSLNGFTLSANIMEPSCYRGMFQGCSGLTGGIDLNSTKLADNCYQGMFSGCTNLTYCQQKLPATELKDYCYSEMFAYCKSLTASTIEFPATVLKPCCYYGTFKRTNLVPDCSNIDFYDGDVLGSGGMQGLFYGTIITKDYLKLANLPYKTENNKEVFYLPLDTLTSSCYKEMFRDCDKLEASFDLTATTLADSCYYMMFCTNITPKLMDINFKGIDLTNQDDTINGCFKGLFAGTNITDEYLGEMLPTVNQYLSNLQKSELDSDKNDANFLIENNVYPENTTGKRYCLPVNTLGNSCYSYMFAYCGNLSIVPELPAMNLANNCYANMFYQSYGTSKIGPSILPAKTLKSSCYASIFGQSNVSSAPFLPATTLANSCYGGMFYIASRHIKAVNYDLIASKIPDSAYRQMFDCESATGLVRAPKVYATSVSGSFSVYVSFRGSELIKAPKLYSKTLSTTSYKGMFSNVNRLEKLTMLATNISAIESITDWARQTYSARTSHAVFIKDKNANLPLNSSSGIPSGWTILNYNDYISIVNLSLGKDENIDENLYIKLVRNGTSQSLSYKDVDDNSNTWNTTSDFITIEPKKGVHIKANLTPIASYGIGTFIISGNSRCDISGNIMSLLHGDDFLNKTDLSEKTYAFYNLFKNCTTISDASDLLLPTKLSNYCFYGMFDGCSGLLYAPELSATTLTSYCYANMFKGCTKLNVVPDLLAETLKNYCYQNMFSGCSNVKYVRMEALDTTASNCLTNFLTNAGTNIFEYIDYDGKTKTYEKLENTFVRHVDKKDLGSIIPDGWIERFYWRD